MIERIDTMWKWIEADAASKNTYISLVTFLKDPILRFCIYLRFNEYLVNSKKPIIVRIFPLLLYKRLAIRLGFSIPLNVFGPGLAIVHYGTIVVHPDSKIGSDVRIHVGVNIGSNGVISSGGALRETVPKIGNHCYIGPGAKLFGDIEIGDHCTIGANAVVNRSFPEPYLTIAGVPARIIKRRAPDAS